MRRWVLMFVGLVVLGALAWWGGYSSEHRARRDAERRVAELQSQLREVRTQARLCALGDNLDRVVHQVQQQNFGLARESSSRFFDAVRQETAEAPERVRPYLRGILETRDSVTAALAQGDPSVVNSLRSSTDRLRQALGGQPIFDGDQGQPGGTERLPASADENGPAAREGDVSEVR